MMPSVYIAPTYCSGPGCGPGVSGWTIAIVMYCIFAPILGFMCWLFEDDGNKRKLTNRRRARRMAQWIFLFPLTAVRWFLAWLRDDDIS